MKLYTEEEVRRAIELNDGRSEDEVLAGLTPIELPSDEDIEKFAFEKYHEIEDSKWFEPLQVGAKWLKNKIQGDNK